VVTVGLGACAGGGGGYDKWAEETNKKISTGYTELILGKQTVEIDADVPKEAAINLAYRIGEGVGLPGRSTSAFYNKLMGDVTYPKSCKTSLAFKVALINKDNALVQTEFVFIPSYDAGIKALISKDVMTDPSKQASSQVVKLRVKDFQCLPQLATASNAVMPTPVKTGQSNAAAFAALTPQQRAAVMGHTSETSPSGQGMSKMNKSILEQALECKAINYKTFDATLKALKIPNEGASFNLPSPITVFGLPVTKIAIFRDSGEDSYTASIAGANVKDVAKAANIKAAPQGSYSKSIKNRTLSVTPETTGGGAIVECVVSNE